MEEKIYERQVKFFDRFFQLFVVFHCQDRLFRLSMDSFEFKLRFAVEKNLKYCNTFNSVTCLII